MGKHFDTLVEIVKDYIDEKEGTIHMPYAREYFSGLIRRAALFEFPLNAENIFPRSGKGCVEYDAYLRDYFDMCERYGSFLLTPFRLTAIEDSVSVVFLDNLKLSDYRVTACSDGMMEGHNIKSIICADVTLQKPYDGVFPIHAKQI